MPSLQSSPEALQGKEYPPHLASPVPFELPEAVTAGISVYRTSTTKEILSPTATPPNRAGGLIRKLSQSAKAGVQSTGQRLRRKTSSSGQGRREQSNGPITRRRSDSKSASVNGTTTVEGLNPADFDGGRFVDSPYVSSFVSTFNDACSIGSDPFSPVQENSERTAPTLPDQLIRGSLLTKVTKRRRKQLNFFLTVDGSTVSWNPAKHSKSFCVDDIRSIRFGQDAVNYRQEYGTAEFESECWFTILYANADRSKQTKAIHLIAPSKEYMMLWIDTLDALSKHREDLMTGLTGSVEREDIIKAHWDREVLKLKSKASFGTEDGALDLVAVETLCQGLHIHCSKAMIQEQFGLADSDNTGLLNYHQFKDFVRRLKERKDILPIFKSLTRGDEDKLTKEQFFSFLQNVQDIDVASGYGIWEHEFVKWVELSEARRPGSSRNPSLEAPTMDFDAFASFLVSEACNVYQPATSTARFDRPLNEYFISSSHNTYLLGRQFAGDSSTEAYITALRHGCRCVEIDCWNGPDGRPIVTHGHTRTTSVLFLDCITVIARYAFESSEYPVIMSLEVHCDAEQQMKMVEIMKDGLGDKLVRYPLPDQTGKLPSPESLKNKILVKVKTSDNSAENGLTPDNGGTRRLRSASCPHDRPTMSEIPAMPNLLLLTNLASISPPGSQINGIHSPNQRSLTVTSASSAGEESDVPQPRKTLPESPRRPKQTSNIVRPLAELGVYLQGYKYRGFATAECQEYNHIFSLDETKAGSLCSKQEDKAQFEDHNLRYLFRVYPKGLRFDSSNFDPNIFWRRGVQMVALNWQTYDRFMQINQAMFAAGTDRQGYVLKPEYLRQPRAPSSEIDSRSRLPRRLVRFSVEIISAQQLPRPPSMDREATINPFVEIQIYNAEDKARGIATGRGGEDASRRNGISGVGTPYGRRTRIVPENGYNPQFNDRFELSVETKYPELVFVRWVVYSSPNGRAAHPNCDQLAVFTAKLSSIQSGYRHLPLYSTSGEEFIFSTLFCKIKKEEPILIPCSLDEVSARATNRSVLRNMLKRNHSSDRAREKLPNIEAQKKKVLEEIRDRQGVSGNSLT